MTARLRNGAHGYGLVTKGLHWTMVAAIATQFVIGYRLDTDGRGRGRGRGRGARRVEDAARGGDFDVFGDGLLTMHVVLGVTILALATIRLAWRLTTPLPPWAPGLTAFERRLAHWTERALYVLMFAIPGTGLWLVTAGDDDAVGVHVAAHVAFFVTITLHVGLVLTHQVFRRDRLLRRML